MLQIVDASPTPPSRINPECPELLDFIVAKALEKNPEDRYQDALELADDLRLCRDSLADEGLAGRASLPGGDTLPLDDGTAPATARTEPGANGPDLPSGAAMAAQQRANTTTIPTMIAGSAAHSTASLGLMPSRRSDSAQALARLTKPSTADRKLLSPAIFSGSGLRRLRQDTDLLGVLALLGAAAAFALYIAFT
jgi:hypothetical protein